MGYGPDRVGAPDEGPEQNMTGDGALSYELRIVFNHAPKMKAQMKAKARLVVAKTALDLEGQMKARVPVDTGFLRSSIKARQVGGNASSGSIHWRVTVGAEYGAYVEFGTRFNRAQPFFFPPVAVVRPTFLEAMRRLLA